MAISPSEYPRAYISSQETTTFDFTMNIGIYNVLMQNMYTVNLAKEPKIKYENLV